MRNLGAPFGKGFNFVRAKPPLRRAESRFGKPRSSLQRERFYSFCVVQKEPKSTLGRAKSCQWQVFVRRRPPKQGELRTDVSKATMFQGDDSVLRPAIQISARFVIFAEVAGHHHVTGGTENRKVSGYRRLGFESVRKGGYTSDARLRIFEKERAFCKLTVADDIRKGLLHVSLGAVESWNFAVLKKGFSLLVGHA